MWFHYARTLEALASQAPDRALIVTPTTTLTAAELYSRAVGLSGWLTQAGVGPGDVVATMLINRPAIVETFYACLLIGAAPANVNSRYGPEDIAYILNDCGAKVLVHEADSTDATSAAVQNIGHPVTRLAAPSEAYEHAVLSAPGAPRELSPDDRILWYTGGTTGKPRGVIWEVDTHYRMLWEVIKPGVEPPDPAELAVSGKTAPTTLPGSPLAHGTAMGLSLNCLNGAGTLVLHEQVSFDAAATLQLIETHQVRVLGIVGDAYARPLLAELDTGRWAGRLTSLAALTSSGAVWSPEVRERLRSHLPGITLIDNFGSTEALVTRDTDGKGFQAREGLVVLGPDDVPVEPGSGQVGVIATAGRLPVGYLGDPVKTAETFRMVNGRRHLLIGDEATIDADGTIHILGRGSSCINTGGEKVWPEEVEIVVRDHPAIADAAIIGLADDTWGQRVTGVIAVDPHHTVSDDELTAHCKGRLTSYKCPKQWIRVGTVPRTYIGKPDYTAIAQLVSQLQGS